MSITCASEEFQYSDDVGACSYNTWRLPDGGENTEINCFGTGCVNFGDIYVDSDVSSLSVNTNKCDQCDGTQCDYPWRVYCDDGAVYEASCGSMANATNCGCGEFQENVQIEDDRSVSECDGYPNHISSQMTPAERTEYILTLVGSLAAVYVFCVCLVLCFRGKCGNRRRIVIEVHGNWNNTKYASPTAGICYILHLNLKMDMMSW